MVDGRGRRSVRVDRHVREHLDPELAPAALADDVEIVDVRQLEPDVAVDRDLRRARRPVSGSRHLAEPANTLGVVEGVQVDPASPVQRDVEEIVQSAVQRHVLSPPVCGAWDKGGQFDGNPLARSQRRSRCARRRTAQRYCCGSGRRYGDPQFPTDSSMHTTTSRAMPSRSVVRPTGRCVNPPGRRAVLSLPRSSSTSPVRYWPRTSCSSGEQVGRCTPTPRTAPGRAHRRGACK